MDKMQLDEMSAFEAEVAALETRMEREKVAWNKLSEEEKQRITHNLNILGAYHSNAMEGNPMSLEDVKVLLDWREA